MIGVYSYLVAALGFGFLAVLLMFSWRSSIQGRLLTIAVFCTALWAVLAMFFALDQRLLPGGYMVAEVVRNLAWYAFLLKLFEPAAQQVVGHPFLMRRAMTLFVAFALLVLAMDLSGQYWLSPESVQRQMPLKQVGHVLLAVIGMAIIEQLYRNITPAYRQALKFLFIGIGVIFVVDFYMYSKALLFRGVDRELWDARGFVSLLAVPLLTLTAARNKDWSPNIFVSRDIVLHSTTVIGSGLYLLVMAGAGYYLQRFGGSWGYIAQITFISLALIFLALVLFSGQLRRELRVFLGKHFYRNKYDYRHEWLTLTNALNEAGDTADSYVSAIRVLAQLVDARAGMLWLRDDHGGYGNRAVWNVARSADRLAATDSLPVFLERTGYVVNLLELQDHPGEYEGLVAPDWLCSVDGAWLVIPLFGPHALVGFVLLARPQHARAVNWEDHDLLKTAARQVAAHLVVLQTSEALSQARQFEVFNRLSAYMVHDLKNIAAGLDMVAKNAGRHRANQEFLDDAFDSVATAAGDIKRLLGQLRSKQPQAGKRTLVDLVELIRGVVDKRTVLEPRPEFSSVLDSCPLTVERERLEHVLLHLVENAQQACAADGRVRLQLSAVDGTCTIVIEDNGAGMDGEFISQRLFKPFDTTKGNAGMGIGMYESREFIQQLGGEIGVSSSPGAGTRVTIVLPATGATSAAAPA